TFRARVAGLLRRRLDAGHLLRVDLSRQSGDRQLDNDCRQLGAIASAVGVLARRQCGHNVPGAVFDHFVRGNDAGMIVLRRGSKSWAAKCLVERAGTLVYGHQVMTENGPGGIRMSLPPRPVASIARAAMRASIVVAALALPMSSSLPCLAQDYPTRPVKIIVPFGAGGPADVYSRVLAQHLSEALKEPFVVEDRPGAGSIIGTDAVAKSPPDGYTLLAM